MAMLQSPDNTLLVSSGSVFSQILLWRPLETNQILYTLQGHEGSILSLRWVSETELISTSDDRSVRIWRGFDLCRNNYSLSSEEATSLILKPSVTMYGHTGRVWDCCNFTFRGNHFIASSSEDLKVALWDMSTGSCVAKLEGKGSSFFFCFFVFCVCYYFVLTNLIVLFT
jgi:WD40 repeat protein